MYTRYSIITCVIYVPGKHATYIHKFYCFIYVFVCVLIVYTFPFRQLNAGPMALSTGDRWQCHPNVGQPLKVDTKVISNYHIMTFILIF